MIHPLKKLTQNFRNEEKELVRLGINTWESIMKLKDPDITSLVNTTICTALNLKRLRCIALFICEMNITQEESALLIHSGISSITALGRLTPEQLVKKTGRLERILGTGRDSIINLKDANLLIKRAKARQKTNCSNQATFSS